MKTLNEMTAADIRVIARENNMPGAWKATKAEMLKFLESINYSQEPQNEPESTEQSQADKLLDKTEKPTEPASESSNGLELIAKKQHNTMLVPMPGIRGLSELKEEYSKTVDEPKDSSHETSKAKSSNLSAKSEESSKPASGLKAYAAWIVDRETKELTTVVGEADSREDFYNAIKSKYRVRLITKPEKLEEECKQWEVKHAQNKVKKNEKYAADKIKAQKMNMSVSEYRKWLRESAKTE